MCVYFCVCYICSCTDRIARGSASVRPLPAAQPHRPANENPGSPSGTADSIAARAPMETHPQAKKDDDHR